MNKFKSFKSLLLASGLTLGISFLTSHSVFAATYTTASGDSLYKISQVFNTTTSKLIADNKLSSTTILPGQKLYVDSKTYVVQAGDSLYLIAKKFGLDLYTLRRANNTWTDKIISGQVLNIPVKTPAPIPVVTKTVTYSSSDVDLLARLITAEAQGEPYTAMVSVGAVVVNRTKSGSFPTSISGVIYQTINGYCQFTPVLNGWINKPALPDAIVAAKAALGGIDPTNGALFYYDNTITNPWLLAKPISLTVDKLIFAY